MLTGVFGLLNIAKPPGPTSHDIVDLLRRRVGVGVKVGHAGTLDPFAQGVLVLCLGPATRLADYIQAQPKRYIATVTLGAVSDTDDPTGRLTPLEGTEAPPADRVRGVLKDFLGAIQQIPPAHSAVHVEGRRAYTLARAGETPLLAPRTVTVHSIELLTYTYPTLELDVSCGGGTYIRALARDIGATLGCGGYCSALIRTAVGPFSIEQAVAAEQADQSRHLLPPVLALGDMPRVTLPAAPCARLAMGQAVKLAREQLPPPAAQRAEPVELAAMDEQGRLLAIGVLGSDGVTFRPSKVFGPG
ncbi:MAG: tRNA pseudouridine(55) synthase TruB [Phycisphaerae bacterium]|nr:tRNA pseudouridine(55) synthase TruB [Phycisphaerae bacterium]